MTEPKLTMPSQTLLQGMQYTPSWDTDIKARFAQMALGLTKAANVQPIARKKA